MIMSNTKDLAALIERDFSQKLPQYHKSRREGLCLLSSIMLQIRSVNLMELASSLTRKIKTQDKRYQYIERLLSNDNINVDEVSGTYAKSILEYIYQNNKIVILSLDQSNINENNEVLMLSIRFGNRALPFIWRVKSTKGSIGFEIQKEILDSALQFIPEGVQVLLAADRFYGSKDLFEWLKQNKWSYRIRMKKNLIIKKNNEEINASELQKNGVFYSDNVTIFDSIKTNIGILQEKGFEEPWIIAMDCLPNKYTVLDYGMRWSIETMFSDFKSRGFGLSDSHIKISKRLDRLILIMAIAMYCAISFGIFEEKKTDLVSIKKGFKN